MNVGRRNPDIIEALKKALDTYDIGVFLCVQSRKRPRQKTCRDHTGDLSAPSLVLAVAKLMTRHQDRARLHHEKEIIYTEKAYHGHTGFALRHRARRL